MCVSVFSALTTSLLINNPDQERKRFYLISLTQKVIVNLFIQYSSDIKYQVGSSLDAGHANCPALLTPGSFIQALHTFLAPSPLPLPPAPALSSPISPPSLPHFLVTSAGPVTPWPFPFITDFSAPEGSFSFHWWYLRYHYVGILFLTHADTFSQCTFCIQDLSELPWEQPPFSFPHFLLVVFLRDVADRITGILLSWSVCQGKGKPSVSEN